jgi:hypothetical protein
MSAVAITFPAQDVWMLACATKYDSKEAVSDILNFCGETAHLAKAGLSVIAGVIRIRGEFNRIVRRQPKLIERLESAPVSEWTPEACAQLAELLEGVVRDNKEMVSCGLNSPARRFWESPLMQIGKQTERLEQVYLHLDALSVCPVNAPLNQEFGEYVAGLDLS